MLYPSSAYNAESDASTAYAVCATPESVATKTVTIPGFVPFEGAMVNIFFIYANYMSETSTGYLNYHPTLKIISDPKDSNVYTDYPMLGMGNDIDSDIKGHLLGGSIYDTWASGAVVTFVFRSKIDTGIYQVIDPTPQGGWVMINAPQVLKHSVYRPGNNVNLDNTYWSGCKYKSDGHICLDIQFRFPYEISGGTIPFIPAVTGINIPTSIPFTVYTPGVGADSDFNSFALDSHPPVMKNLVFNYKLGMMTYTLDAGATTKSITTCPVLVWFHNTNLEITFTGGNS